MTLVEETWSRIEEANIAAGWSGDWSLAERDQLEALADEMNLELLTQPVPNASPWLHDVNAAHRQHMREVAQRAKDVGWQYVDDRSCPRRLVDKRCKGLRCWCGSARTGSHWPFRNLNDHGGTWFCENHWGPHQQRFVLWEPYAARGEHVAELVSVAEQDGLQVCITASVWNPPHTIGIAFYPKDQTPPPLNN